MSEHVTESYESVIKANFTGRPAGGTLQGSKTGSISSWFLLDAISERSGSRDSENIKRFLQNNITGSQYSRSLDGRGVDYSHPREGLDYFHNGFFDLETGKSRVTFIADPSSLTESMQEILDNTGYEWDRPASTAIDFYNNAKSLNSVPGIDAEHGTGCYAVAASSVYGVAPSANIIVYPFGINGLDWDDTAEVLMATARHKNKPINPNTGYKDPTVLSFSSGKTFDFHFGHYYVGSGDATLTLSGSDILDTPFRINYFNTDFTFVSSSTSYTESYDIGSSTGSGGLSGDITNHLLHYYTNSIDGLVTLINDYYDIPWSHSIQIDFVNSTPSNYIFKPTEYVSSPGGDENSPSLILYNSNTGERYFVVFSGSGYLPPQPYSWQDPYQDSFRTGSREAMTHNLIKIDISAASTAEDVTNAFTQSVKDNMPGVFIDESETSGTTTVIHNSKGFLFCRLGQSDFPFNPRSAYRSSQRSSTWAPEEYSFTWEGLYSITGGVPITEEEFHGEQMFSASYDSDSDLITISLLRPLEMKFNCYTGSLNQIQKKDYPLGGHLYASASASEYPHFGVETFAPFGTPLSTYTPGHPDSHSIGDGFPLEAGYRLVLPVDHMGNKNIYNGQFLWGTQPFSGSTTSQRTSRQYELTYVGNDRLNILDPFVDTQYLDVNFAYPTINTGSLKLINVYEEAAREGVIIFRSAGNAESSPPTGKFDITGTGSEFILDYQTSSFSSESYFTTNKNIFFYGNPSGSPYYYAHSRWSTGAIIESSEIRANVDTYQWPGTSGPSTFASYPDSVIPRPWLYNKVDSENTELFTSSVLLNPAVPLDYGGVTESLKAFNPSDDSRWIAWRLAHNTSFSEYQTESLNTVIDTYTSEPSNLLGVFAGSSASSPKLAGFACLLLQKYPWMKVNDVKNFMQYSASKQFTTDNGKHYGDGSFKFYYRDRYDPYPIASTHSLSFNSGSSVMGKFILGTGDGTQAITESKKIVTYEDPVGLKYAIIFSSSNAAYYNGSGLQYIPSEYTIIKTDVDASTDEAGGFDYGVRIANALTQAIDQIPYATYSATTSDLDDGLIKIHPYPSGGTATMGFAITGGFSEYNYDISVLKITNSIQLTNSGNLAGDLFHMWDEDGQPVNGLQDKVVYNPFFQEATNLNVEGDVKFKGTKITSFKS